MNCSGRQEVKRRTHLPSPPSYNLSLLALTFTDLKIDQKSESLQPWINGLAEITYISSTETHTNLSPEISSWSDTERQDREKGKYINSQRFTTHTRSHAHTVYACTYGRKGGTHARTHAHMYVDNVVMKLKCVPL